MSDPIDELPGLVASIGQMAMFMREYMPLVAAVRDTALDNGFDRNEAVQLSQAWMISQMRQASK